MNSVKTFPSRTEGMPRAYFPVSTTVRPMDAQFASAQQRPFHAIKMQGAREGVMNAARMNKSNKLKYSIGGTRNLLPKSQPQGSKIRLFGTESGNAHYGYGLSQNLMGSGGSFRTKAGSEYGKRILQKRGRQLEELAAAREGVPTGGYPHMVQEQPVPLTQSQAKQEEFALLFGEIEARLGGGEGTQAFRPEDYRRLFSLLRQTILDMPQSDLQDYYQRISNLTEYLEQFIGGDEYNTEQYRGVGPTLLSLEKVLNLLKVGIASVKKPERERQTLINQFVREINRVRPVEFTRIPGVEGIMNSRIQVQRQSGVISQATDRAIAALNELPDAPAPLSQIEVPQRGRIPLAPAGLPEQISGTDSQISEMGDRSVRMSELEREGMLSEMSELTDPTVMGEEGAVGAAEMPPSLYAPQGETQYFGEETTVRGDDAAGADVSVFWDGGITRADQLATTDSGTRTAVDDGMNDQRFTSQPNDTRTLFRVPSVEETVLPPVGQIVQPSGVESIPREVLEERSVSELRELAREAGIRGRSRMRKAELIENLESFTAGLPSPAEQRQLQRELQRERAMRRRATSSP